MINSLIWHKNVPFKMTFLRWRALMCKLPTNENLENFEVEALRCYCCRKQALDDIDSIFWQEHRATHIWIFFPSSLGITTQQTSLSNYLVQWCDNKGKNDAHKTIINILPIVVCWNLWKNRCVAKYGGKTFSTSKVNYLILKYILLILYTIFSHINGLLNGPNWLKLWKHANMR